MSERICQDTRVDFESALATAVAITGITQASPGVVSYTDAGASDPSDGNFVVFPGLEGMTELRDRIARVANVVGGSDTFEVEGIDTSLFGAFSSGNFNVITFGTGASTFTDVTASGGDANFLEYGLIHDRVRRKIPTTFNNAEITFTSLFDLASATLNTLKSRFETSTLTGVRLTLNNGNIILAYGYITAPLVPQGTSGELVTTEVSFSAQGFITGYAS